MSITAATLRVVVEADTKAGEAGLRRVSDQADGLGSHFSGATKAVGLLTGALAAVGVGAFAKSAVSDFIAFQGGMNEVFTLLPGISGKALGEMTDQTKALSKEMGVLPEKVVPALYQAISAGVPQDNVFDFLKTAQKAAVGGVTDLTTAVDGITSTINAYGTKTLSATQASDMMFTAVRLGKTDFEQLSKSLFNVNPIAASLGVKFGDVSAALAAMTVQGVPTSVATTQIRQALVEMSQSGTKASQAFQSISGKTFKDFIAGGGNVSDALNLMAKKADLTHVGINDLFGSVEAGSAALALTGKNAQLFADDIAEMNKSSGATDAAFNRMEQGIGRSLAKLQAAFAVWKLDIGEKLAPPVAAAVDFLLTKAIPAFAEFGSSITGALAPVGEVFSSFGKYIGFVVSEGDTMNDWLTHLPGPLQGVAQVIGEVVSGLGFYGKALLAAARGQESFGAILGGVGDVLDMVRGHFGDIVRYVLAWAQSLAGTVGPLLANVWKGFSDGITAALPAVQRFIGIVVNDIVPNVLILARIAADQLGPILQKLAANIFPLLATAAVQIASGIAATLKVATDFFRKLEDGDPTASKIAKTIEGLAIVVGGLLVFEQVTGEINKFVTATENGIGAAKKFVDVLNPLAGESGKVVTQVRNLGTSIGNLASKAVSLTISGFEDLYLRWLLFKDSFNALKDKAVKLAVDGANDAATAVSTLWQKLNDLKDKTVKVVADTLDAEGALARVKGLLSGLTDTTVKVTVDAPDVKMPKIDFSSVATSIASGFGGALAGGITLAVGAPEVLGAIAGVPVSIGAALTGVLVTMLPLIVGAALAIALPAGLIWGLVNFGPQVAGAVADAFMRGLGAVPELLGGAAALLAAGVVLAIIGPFAAAFRGAQLLAGVDWSGMANDAYDGISRAFTAVFVTFPEFVGGIIRDGLSHIPGIDGALGGLTALFEGDFSGMGDRIHEIMGGIADGIGASWEAAGRLGDGAINLMTATWEGDFSGFTDRAGTILGALGSTFESAWHGISETGSSIVAGATALWEGDFSGFTDRAGTIMGALGSTLEPIWNGIQAAGGGAMDGLRALANGDFSGIADAGSRALNGISELAGNLPWADEIGGAIQAAWDWAGGILDQMQSGFMDTWNGINRATDGALNEMTGAVADGLIRVLGFFLDLPNKINGALQSLALDLHNIGVNAINGLIGGIESMGPAAYNAAKAAGKKVVDGLKFWEGSPWPETINSGKLAGEGLVTGVETWYGRAELAGRTLGESVMQSADDRIRELGAAGGAIITDFLAQFAPAAGAATAVSSLAASMAGAVAPIDEYRAALYGAREQLQNVDEQLRALQRSLANTKPGSDTAKAIKEHIQSLQQDRTEIQATIKSYEDMTTTAVKGISALDGWNDALARVTSNAANLTQFGQIGLAAINALNTAMLEDSPKAGAAAVTAVQAAIDAAHKAGVEGWQALGAEAMRLYGIALDERTPDAIQAALDSTQAISDAIIARNEALKPTLASSFAAAVDLTALTAQIGSQWAGLFTATSTAITAGKDLPVAALGQFGADMQARILKMPPAIAAALGPEWDALWAAFQADPNGESLASLQAFAVRVTTTVKPTMQAAFAAAMDLSALTTQVGSQWAGLFTATDAAITDGKDLPIAALGQFGADMTNRLAALPADMAAAFTPKWNQIWADFRADPNDATLASLERFATNATAATALFPDSLRNAVPQIRQYEQELFGEVNAGSLTLIQAQERLADASKLFPDSLRRALPEVKAAANAIWDEYHSGALNIQQAIDKINDVTNLIPANLHKLPPQVQADIMAMITNWGQFGGSVEDVADRIATAVKTAADATALAASQMQSAIAAIGSVGGSSSTTGSSVNGQQGIGVGTSGANQYGIPGLTSSTVTEPGQQPTTTFTYGGQSWAVAGSGALADVMAHFGFASEVAFKQWIDAQNAAFRKANFKDMTGIGAGLFGTNIGDLAALLAALGHPAQHAGGGVFRTPTMMLDMGGKAHLFGEKGPEPFGSADTLKNMFGTPSSSQSGATGGSGSGSRSQAPVPNQTFHNSIQIIQQPGESADQLAQRVLTKLQQKMQRNN